MDKIINWFEFIIPNQTYIVSSNPAFTFLIFVVIPPKDKYPSCRLSLVEQQLIISKFIVSEPFSERPYHTLTVCYKY